MTCRECLDRLPAMLDEPDLETGRHLAECGDCRRQYDLLRRGLALLEAEAEPRGPALHDGVWAAVDAQAARQRELAALAARDARRALGLAAALLVAAAAFVLWRYPGLLPGTAPEPLVRSAWVWLTELASGLWTAFLDGLLEAQLGAGALLADTPAWVTSGWLLAGGLAAAAMVEWRTRRLRLAPAPGRG